jgi:hypothetical protein
VAVARLLWRDWQKTCDPARLIFLDETGAGTDMTSGMAAALWESDVMTTLPAVTGKP